MNKSIVSLVTISTVTLFSFSAFADNHNIMTNQQNSTTFGNNNSTTISDSFLISLSAGTKIPVIYEEAEKILVTKDETLPITVKVTKNIINDTGKIIIPIGSQVVGEIQPAGKGSRFVAQYLILPDQSEVSLVAYSSVITSTEVIEAGKNTDAIWQGALAGSAAATIIAAVTGDTAIATEEVLGGAGFGALAGFLFGGNNTQELISINTREDLNLTLRADLYF